MPAYPGYSITDDGRIWSDKTWRGQAGRWLKPHTNRHGYPHVSLWVGGQRRTVKVHRLVCWAFHGPPPLGKPNALHRNGIPSDCRAENLYWGSYAENEADKAAHGTKSYGETHASAKLTTADIPVIREQHAAGVRNVAQAGRYGVSETAIRKIVRRETWAHVPMADAA